MTTGKRRREIVYLKHQLKMAERRLAMVRYSLSREHDPALASEAEMLEIQAASMRRELAGLESEAA